MTWTSKTPHTKEAETQRLSQESIQTDGGETASIFDSEEKNLMFYVFFHQKQIKAVKLSLQRRIWFLCDFDLSARRKESAWERFNRVTLPIQSVGACFVLPERSPAVYSPKCVLLSDRSYKQWCELTVLIIWGRLKLSFLHLKNNFVPLSDHLVPPAYSIKRRHQMNIYIFSACLSPAVSLSCRVQTKQHRFHLNAHSGLKVSASCESASGPWSSLSANLWAQ